MPGPGPEPRSARVGRIVEVEAYVGTDDQASHARFGRTTRNAVMFGPPGVAYVYLVYGMYCCLNVVTEPEGRAAAVLVRAVEPLAGPDTMRAARLRHELARRRTIADPDAARRRLAQLPEARLASGPGSLAAAFDIDRALTGLDLLDPRSPLRIEAGSATPATIVGTPRIGIEYAPEPWRSQPWRFVDPTSPAVSTMRPPATRRTR
jgi:DNA-3-methyladenine glycosylase